MSPTDEYEQRYMAGGDHPLHREKTKWSMHWLLLMWVPFCLAMTGLIAAGVGSRPAPLALALLPLGLSGFFATLWAMFLFLRVHVTSLEVHIQYGLWGPKIPVQAIQSCEVVDYDATKFGGWGIRRSTDGTWAYCLMGDGGKVVEITWLDGASTRKLVVSSPDPTLLVSKIMQARALASGKNRVCIDAQLEEPEEVAVQSDTTASSKTSST